MKKTFLFAITCCMALLITSCSKKNGTDPVNKIKTAKFTVSVADFNAQEGDDAYFIIVGTDASGPGTAWKVNGQVRSNETGITISKEELISGTPVVIESTKPLFAATTSVSGNNINSPFIIKYKAEINGKVENDITESVTTRFDKQLSY